MPDLITHAGLGLLLRIPARRSPLVWFIVGSCLPDVAARLPALTLALASSVFQFSLSQAWMDGTGMLHLPLPFVLLCLLMALLLPLDIRRVAFVNLALGGVVHLTLDLTQYHLNGGYRVFFPFSMSMFELGWISNEASLDWLPYTVPVFALVLLIKVWRENKKADRG